MALNVFGWLHGSRAAQSGRRPVVSRRPSLESLEEREVLSHSPVAPVAEAVLVAQAATVQQPVSLPVTITGVSIQNGQLLANGLLGNQPFTAPLTLSTSPNAADPATPILNLHLGPIHLDLLGLNVDTSEICLDVTAQPGPGNLLGNLLSGVAGLLDGGTPLGTILGGLTPTQTQTLTSGLTGLLGGVFTRLTSPAAAQPTSTCDILNLALGPVDLNLLGLNVHLDDCNGGPVTLDITADPGSGHLLGNLLCGIAHVLDRGVSLPVVPPGITHQLDHLFARLDRLIDRLF